MLGFAAVVTTIRVNLSVPADRLTQANIRWYSPFLFVRRIPKSVI
jgi:hypothetical protein